MRCATLTPTRPPSPPRQSFLTLLLALPALALRDPKLRGGELGGKEKFTIVFLLLGVVAIPMWVPHLGMIMVSFTAVLPSERARRGGGGGAGRRGRRAAQGRPPARGFGRPGAWLAP
jgi:hypothetical protein